jgi:FkbM family methyltransferase
MDTTPLPEPDFAYGIAANEYGFYCVPEAYKAREVPRVLTAGGVYEPATLRLMQRLMGTGDVIAGGAFIGDFLPALHGALAPGAQLHSFEPNPVSRAACAVTIALNGLTRVTVHACAVGAEAGQLPLQVAKPGGEVMGARAKIADQHVAGETLEVPVQTLDSLIDPGRTVSVLQLDIEGHEGPALDGAVHIVRASRPVILLEAPKAWQQRAHAARLDDLFPGLGYRFCGALERNAVFRSLPA